MRKVSIIIPCYNSGPHLPATFMELVKLNKQIVEIGMNAQFVMVDDGSSDNTLELLLNFKTAIEAEVVVVNLTGNFGSYSAFLAGCAQSNGDCCIQLHDDLQDPPEHIPQMLNYWKKGVKFVIAQRVAREEPFWHRTFAITYHWLIKKLALPHVPTGGYDLILFDKELREHIISMNEANTNLVYLISWLRYPYVTIPITRRLLKSPSRWNFNKRIKLVVDSFVSFSYFPIRLVSILAIFSMILFGVITALFFTKHTEFVVWFISLNTCMVLFCISVVAEYLYRTLQAAQKRPPYIINKVY